MRRANDLCLTAFFIAFIAGCAAWTGFRMVRDRADFPKIAYKRDFPRAFEKYFAARLGGGDSLLAANAAIKAEALGVSPTPRVALGRDGWMFYETTQEADAIRAAKLSPEFLAGWWTGVALQWRQWFADRGTRLVIVVAPDKQSIYPEFLPSGRGVRRVATQFDLILDAWGKDSRLEVVDLRGDLREASRESEVYLRTDTHWNHTGMLVGYRTLAKRLGWEPRRPAEFTWTTGLNGKTDIPPMMALTWARAETVPVALPRYERKAHETAEIPEVTKSRVLGHMQPGVWEGGDPVGPRVVLFHDSFAAPLYKELVAGHCRRLVTVPTNTPDSKVFEAEKPDVVIWLFVERLLRTGIPEAPPH